MKNIFISLMPNPPIGFEYKRPTKRDLLANRVALFADSIDSALILLDNFSERVYGLIITEGDRFSHSLIGTGLWHLVVTTNMFPNLREVASGFLKVMSHGQIALDENKSLKKELAHSRAIQKKTRDSYNGAIERLGKKIEALRASEENLRTTLNSIGDAVISTDLSGKVVGMNPMAETLIGWKFEEIEGKAITDIFHIINGFVSSCWLSSDLQNIFRYLFISCNISCSIYLFFPGNKNYRIIIGGIFCYFAHI